MAKKRAEAHRRCFDCTHYEACQSWNIGSLVDTDAAHCVNYRESANVEPIVRCKDCAHHYYAVDCAGRCRLGIGDALLDEDYCSRAEPAKKEG